MAVIENVPLGFPNIAALVNFEPPPVDAVIATPLSIFGAEPPRGAVSYVEFGGRLNYAEGDFRYMIGIMSGTIRMRDPNSRPVSRKVLAFRERDGFCVAETWSGDDGAYEFIHLDYTKKHTIVSIDHERNFTTVLASGVFPRLPA